MYEMKELSSGECKRGRKERIKRMMTISERKREHITEQNK